MPMRCLNISFSQHVFTNFSFNFEKDKLATEIQKLQFRFSRFKFLHNKTFIDLLIQLKEFTMISKLDNLICKGINTLTLTI